MQSAIIIIIIIIIIMLILCELCRKEVHLATNISSMAVLATSPFKPNVPTL